MASQDSHHDDGDHGHHGPGYFKVYLILVVLFLISVAGPEIAYSVEMPKTAAKALVLFTAFGIALVKAYYVVAYFMHLKFEKKIISYMLTVTLVFMFLFFSAVAPDVMKHEGSNWVNQAAADEVTRALKAEKDKLLNPKKVVIGNLEPMPKTLTSFARTGEEKYQMPIDIAMARVVSNGARQVTIIVPKDPNAATEEMFAAAEAKVIELAANAPAPFVPDPAKAAHGEKLYTSKTCSACHSIDGSKIVGPSFKGFYGKAGITDKAEVVVGNFAYFSESIKKPSEKVVRGYAKGQMPVLPVNDEEIEAIWHYVASLK